MAIESAGEQRYYDFIADKTKKNRLLDISCLSLISAGFIAFTSKAEECIFIGLILVIIGVVIAVKSTMLRNELHRKLEVIEDKKKFFHQLVSKDTVEFKDLRLLVTNDYLLKNSDELYIYKIADLKNVEIRNNKLLIVDCDNKRHEIALNEKGKEDSFDTVCQLLAILI